MQFLYILSLGEGGDVMQGALCWVELPSKGLAGLRSGDSGEVNSELVLTDNIVS